MAVLGEDACAVTAILVQAPRHQRASLLLLVIDVMAVLVKAPYSSQWVTGFI